nr:acyl-CoA desaturase [Pseudomonadota bacterium]
IAVYHVTFFINSLCHILGKQRFESHDDSRNNLWLALLTFGEGWHNNHHRYPASARQGFYWWEIDITYYILSFMEKIGIIYDMRKVPENILQEGKQLDQQQHSS